MKKIIRRITLILINILLVFSNDINVFGNNADIINNYFDKWDWRFLLKSNLYAYKVFSADFKSCEVSLREIKVGNIFMKSGTSPSKQKYQEVLTNIIFTYDFNTSEKISEQYKLDKLKSGKDYLIDAKDIIVDAVSIYSWEKKDSGKMEEILTTAIDGLSVLIDNSDNYLETISNLETILYNYGKYDEFLSYIYENSQGELKEAAKELNSKLTNLMKIKLDMYTDVTDENFQNFSETFMSDIFIETIKQTNDYANDECLQTITGVGEKILDIDELYKSVEDLMFITAKTVGNITVGGENLINRAFEIEALSDIEEIVSKMIFEQQNELLENQSLENLEKYVYNCKILSCIHIRGEYCVSNISKDAGIWAILGFTNIKEDEEWYKSRAEFILNLYNNLDNLLYDFKEEQATEETTQNYEWYLEPTIQADNIIVPDYESELFGNYAIIERNNKYGIISKEGKVEVECSNVGYDVCVLGNTTYYMDNKINNNGLNESTGYILENNKLIKTNNYHGHDGDYIPYYYDKSISSTLLMDLGIIEIYNGNEIFPVQEVSNKNANGYYETFGKYGLIKGKEVIKDFVYTNGVYTNNLIALEKNGLWEYYDRDGNEIIPLKSKSSDYKTQGDCFNSINKSNFVAFMDVNGIIAINTENGGCFYDIKGNKIINTNDFEEVRPMINGYAWVKVNGKWGLIKSIEKVTVEEQSEELKNNTLTNNKYQVINESMTWHEAKEYCEKLGGHLVTITSQEEQSFINSLLNEDKNLYWIGLLSNNNNWEWITGEDYKYTNWAKDEPNDDFNETEKVVQIYAKDHNNFYKGEWNDSRIDSGTMEFWQLTNVGFICEFENDITQNIELTKENVCIAINNYLSENWTGEYNYSIQEFDIFEYDDYFNTEIRWNGGGQPNTITGYSCKVDYDGKAYIYHFNSENDILESFNVYDYL